MNIKKIGVGLMITIGCSCSAFAQRGAIEIGIAGGVAACSNPGSNMAYKGNRTVFTNYSGLFNASYNIHRSMAVGLEVRGMELSRKSDAVYTTFPNTIIGGDDRKFVYAKSLISAGAVFNGRYSTYRGYFYGGGALGYAMSRHDSQNLNTKRESYRAPDGGNGLMLGVQAGYTHGLSSVIGLNIEGALRNYSLSYEALAPEIKPSANLKYNITAYTVTVGFKFRIMPKYRAQNDIPAMRGKGRSRSQMK